MTDTTLSDQIKLSADNLLPHLRNYAQADEEGIMVLASRQAIEEAAEMIERMLPLIASHEKREAELVEALEEERKKFQQETLRTSESAVLLKRWIERARYHNHDNTWSGAKNCEWCTLVGDSVELLEAPINLRRASIAIGEKP